MKSASYRIFLAIALISMGISFFLWMLEPVPRHLPLWTFNSALIWQLIAFVLLIFAFRDCRLGFLLAAFSVFCVLRCIGVNGFRFDFIPVILSALSLIFAFFTVVYTHRT